MIVKLTYFKPSGKSYSEGEYETKVPAVDLSWPKDVKAPPLHQIFDVPDHPHRHFHLLPGSEP